MPKKGEKIGMVIADKAHDHLPNKKQKNSEEKDLSKHNEKEKVLKTINIINQIKLIV